jgi:hypothetical protein
MDFKENASSGFLDTGEDMKICTYSVLRYRQTAVMLVKFVAKACFTLHINFYQNISYGSRDIARK